MRKVLMVSLALAIGLGLAGTAFAASTTRTHVFSDVTNAEQAYYLDYLGSIGIFRGDTGAGGPARPNDTITRAEYAVVVVRMLGREGLANMMAGFAPPYGDAADIPAWAAGAVNVLTNMSILRGDESGNFRPNDPVKGAEALAMLLRALQNDSLAVGVWPMNYMMAAYDLDCLTPAEDTALLPEADLASWQFIGALIPITRAQMALLTYNALWAFRGWDAEDQEYSLAPLAWEYTDGGLLTGYNLADSEIELWWGDDVYDLAAVVTLYGGSSLDAFMYRYVLYATSGDKVVWVETAPGQVTAGAFKAWDDADGSDPNYYIVLSDDTKVEFGLDGTPFRVNGDDGLLYYYGTPTTPDGGVEDIVEAGDQVVCVLDDEGFATYVTVLHEEDAAFITAKPAADTDPDDNIVGTISVAGDFADGSLDLLTTTTFTGDVSSFAGLAESDIVYVALVGADTDDVFAIHVVRETRTGTISEVVETYPGPEVTVEFTSGSPLTLSGEGADGYWSGSQGVVGEEWTYCLDRDGEGRLGERVGGAAAVYPLVKITGYQARSGKDRITVMDYAGATHTYNVGETDDAVGCYVFSAADIGYVYELVIAGRAEAEADNDGTNAGNVVEGDVIDAYQISNSGETWFPCEVYAIDAATGAITLGSGSWFWYTVNPEVLVFEADYDNGPGQVGAYVGLGGLEVGDLVHPCFYQPEGASTDDVWLIHKYWDEDSDGDVWEHVWIW